ncbi:MAG: hypothetical protein U0R80_03150 [Nocardioidaceae bacterium]
MVIEGRPGRPRWWWPLAWLVAAATAVAVGIVAVSSVGASVRDRGPLGTRTPSAAEQDEGRMVVDPGATRVRRSIDDEFGRFDVECRGVVAFGITTSTRDGWRTVSFEPGPDDDVDAVFSKRGRSIELEVYCNRGEPTIGDREVKSLPADGD